MDEDWIDDHAIPARSLAEHHARRLLDDYGMTAPLTWDQLVYIAEQEGLRVEVDPLADDEGVYVGGRCPRTVLRRADPRVLGHELGHHRWIRQDDHDVRLYYTWWECSGEEAFCEELAERLTRDPEDWNHGQGYRHNWDEPGADEEWGNEL